MRQILMGVLLLTLGGLGVPSALTAADSNDFRPDPKSVQRYGPP